MDRYFKIVFLSGREFNLFKKERFSFCDYLFVVFFLAHLCKSTGRAIAVTTTSALAFVKVFG